jgi:hypothetical protein
LSANGMVRQFAVRASTSKAIGYGYTQFHFARSTTVNNLAVGIVSDFVGAAPMMISARKAAESIKIRWRLLAN